MLVTPAWLAARLDDPGVAVVDMRWREDGSGPDLEDALNWARMIVARYEGHLPTSNNAQARRR